MARPQSVINLDPIDRNNKKRSGIIGRFFKTRRYKGKPMFKTDDYGHYLFCGKQRQGKTTSAIWFRDYLIKKYKKKDKRLILFDNMGLGGYVVTKYNFPDLIDKCEYNPDKVYIFLIDEIQSWYDKDAKDTTTLNIISRLVGQFSQVGKRQIYVLSTAQIYGRVNKSLREQCLYMVNCRPSYFRNKCVNDFIPGDDVLCDDLGRWSGEPIKILIHGIPDTQFDTHLMIKC